jgi:hypothetical protein
MSVIYKGIIADLISGLVSTVPMAFMKFDDKFRAMTASFISRFELGL